MEELPGAILQIVLSKTEASDCARAACVSRRWHQNSDYDELWRSFCLRDFSLSEMLDPQGQPCDSFKTTYKSWRTIFEEYPRPLVARAKRCFDQIKDWLSINFVEVLESLRPGASVEDIEAAEEELGFQLPPPVRLLYYLCDGQDLPEDNTFDAPGSKVSNQVGLLGGYYFYQHFVNVYLLPLQQLVKLTLAVVPKLGLPNNSRRVVIAASSKSVKVFFLDCDDGQVYVGTRNLRMNGEMMPCTPIQEGGVDLKDGMLRWLEWYNHCLQNELFSVRVESRIRSISLFPVQEPLCTTAVTRGIQIQTSAVFVPELSTTEEEDEDSFLFSYSVGLRLLSPNSERRDSCMESAQLLARHWVIKPDGFMKTEVRGEAVIGQYPLLKADGKEFVYQSCSSLKSKSGVMEGDFAFVPGRIMNPDGDRFLAYVASFPLEVPQVIF